MGIDPTDLGVASYTVNRQARTVTVTLATGEVFTLARGATTLAGGESIVALRVKHRRKVEVVIRKQDGTERTRWHHPEETRPAV